MRTFEVGKRYGESAVVFEITKELQKLSHTQQYTTPEDTTKTAEKKKRAKVHDWGSREVFFAGSETVEA